MVEIVTACQSVLCRLSVGKDYQSVYLHVLSYQQWLDSFSPSTGLDSVCFFPCGRRQVFRFRDLTGHFSYCGDGFLSLHPN